MTANGVPSGYENWLSTLEGRLRGENGVGGGPSLRERHQAPERQQEAQPARRGAEPDPYAALKSEVQRAVIAKLGPQIFGADSVSDLREPVHAAVVARLEASDTPLARDERRRLAGQITDDILGYGPLEPFLEDNTVTEIMVNGYDQVFIERDGKIESTGATFADDAHLLRIIDRIVSQVGRRIDEASPMVDARLPDGSRVNAVIPPLALDGPALTIRKFSRDPYTIGNLIVFGTLSTRGGLVPAQLRRGPAQHPDLRRHRHRQDDPAQRAVRLRSRVRADHHHRGRGRAAAPAAAHDPARGAPARTSRARARCRSASWSATRCACGRIGSSSARSAARRPWTCCRR